jgi:hypothetical protein
MIIHADRRMPCGCMGWKARVLDAEGNEVMSIVSVDTELGIGVQTQEIDGDLYHVPVSGLRAECMEHPAGNLKLWRCAICGETRRVGEPCPHGAYAD